MLNPKKKLPKKTIPKNKKFIFKPNKPASTEEAQAPRPGESLQPPRGMRDILPTDEPFWTLVKEKAEALSHAFGYGFIATPLLEHRSLFVRGVGSSTDIVQKEMYCFKDQGGDELCLRPENTAAIARAYVSHGMLNLPQPVKLWYMGSFFRRERPQSGRFREFHQWGVEVLGDTHPVLDAEVISIALNLFSDLALPVRLEINSIGCEQCRNIYKEELLKFYSPKAELLCETCKVRLEQNRLRLLDCKEPQCELLREGAPQITDMLCEPCRDHFMRVLEYLDELSITYNLNPLIVRGLDYYNRTVFEIFPLSEDGTQKTENGEKTEEKDAENKGDEEDPSSVSRPLSSGSQSALGGGGRYDGLVEQLGGRPAGAVGFSLGLERIVALMRASESSRTAPRASRIFIAQLGDGARRRALSLWHALLREVPTVTALSKDGLKAQLEIANRLGVRYVIIIGQKELLDQTAIIRDMEAGIQEVIDWGKVVSEIKKKLGNVG